MEGNYYINFLTIVQLAVAFCLGMIFMDRKSSIVMLQSSIFDNLRKNRLACLIMRVAGNVTKNIKTKSVPSYISEYREDLNALKYEYRAALDTERTCRFMAAVGTVAGFYSVTWLFYVPYFAEMSDGKYLDIFLSCSLATIVVLLLCFVLDIYSKLSSNRVNCASLAFALWVISLIAALFFYSNGWSIDVQGYSQKLYGWCVVICFMPVWALLVRIIIDVLRRVVLIVSVSKRTGWLKLWKMKCPGADRIIQLRKTHPKYISPLRAITFIITFIVVFAFGIFYYLFVFGQWILKKVKEMRKSSLTPT